MKDYKIYHYHKEIQIITITHCSYFYEFDIEKDRLAFKHNVILNKKWAEYAEGAERFAREWLKHNKDFIS